MSAIFYAALSQGLGVTEALEPAKTSARKPRKPMTPEARQQFAEMRREGATSAAIAERTGYSVDTVNHHLREMRRAENG